MYAVGLSERVCVCSGAQRAQHTKGAGAIGQGAAVGAGWRATCRERRLRGVQAAGRMLSGRSGQRWHGSGRSTLKHTAWAQGSTQQSEEQSTWCTRTSQASCRPRHGAVLVVISAIGVPVCAFDSAARCMHSSPGWCHDPLKPAVPLSCLANELESACPRVIWGQWGLDLSGDLTWDAASASAGCCFGHPRQPCWASCGAHTHTHTCATRAPPSGRQPRSPAWSRSALGGPQPA